MYNDFVLIGPKSDPAGGTAARTCGGAEIIKEGRARSLARLSSLRHTRGRAQSVDPTAGTYIERQKGPGTKEIRPSGQGRAGPKRESASNAYVFV